MSDFADEVEQARRGGSAAREETRFAGMLCGGRGLWRGCASSRRWGGGAGGLRWSCRFGDAAAELAVCGRSRGGPRRGSG